VRSHTTIASNSGAKLVALRIRATKGKIAALPMTYSLQVPWKGIGHFDRFGMVSHTTSFAHGRIHLPPIVKSLLLTAANGIG
jgi:hypothetical protein